MVHVQSDTRRVVAWAVVAVVLLGVALVRWRVRDVPLERDEGEYAYMGQLLRDGVPPYREAANHKFPGTYLAYAGMMSVFGETPAGVHLGLLVVNAATIVALFVLARRLLADDVAAAIAAAAYAVASLSPGVLGTAAHLTHFVVLPVVVGMLLLDRGGTAAVAAAGVSFGLSVVVRQTSVAFVAFGLLWLAAASWRTTPPAVLGRRVATFALGVVAPLLAMTLWLWHAGALPQFWRWTFVQAATYGSEISLTDGLQLFTSYTGEVVRPTALLWLGAAVGLVRALVDRRPPGLALAGLLAASCAVVAAGLRFTNHYYVQMLPAVALLFGYAVAATRTRGARAAALIAAAAALAQPLVADADVLFTLPPDAVARRLYDGNPFPEAPAIARYLAGHTTPADRIAILGSEPEILFLAHRRSATSTLYAYPLVEPTALARVRQQETIDEIERVRPAYVVYVGIATSWTMRPDSDPFIFAWARQYLGEHYRLDGVVEVSADGARFAWGDEASAVRSASADTIRVFRRRDAAPG